MDVTRRHVTGSAAVTKQSAASALPSDYPKLLSDLKSRIQTARVKAHLAVNRERTLLYWNVGRTIEQRQNEEGWGAAVIPRLAADLQHEIPELTGFSQRNLKRMIAFYREYPDLGRIVPQAAAQLPEGSPMNPPRRHSSDCDAPRRAHVLDWADSRFQIWLARQQSGSGSRESGSSGSGVSPLDQFFSTSMVEQSREGLPVPVDRSRDGSARLNQSPSATDASATFTHEQIRWLVATNLNNNLKRSIIKAASQVAGLTYGQDVSVEF